MVKNVVKIFSCLVVMLMMVSLLPSDALAAENDVKLDNMGRQDPSMDRYGNMSKSNAGMDKPDNMNDRIPEFETEEEEFEYFQNDMFELIDKWINDLENKKEDLDESDNENINVEKIDEQIEVLNSIKQEVESAESLEELEVIRKSIVMSQVDENEYPMSRNMNGSDSGIDGDKKVIQKTSEFNAEEGTFDSIKNKVFGFFAKWI
ncbi:hypothetical protein LI82_00410 [Methanococcoides methylutens]|uniref:Uncharacterized protein n=1 Tax=Methanococcoides methylutens TaxID=2226 RepID=A0A099T4E6_METMT|nr:hypothetical protein [Methanococcoides methylutens]KGK99719.1 hypothetical protein LI82_00410 [Methanococcoides methylutens]